MLMGKASKHGGFVVCHAYLPEAIYCSSSRFFKLIGVCISIYIYTEYWIPSSTVMVLNTCTWDDITPITKIIYHDKIPFMIVKSHNCR